MSRKQCISSELVGFVFHHHQAYQICKKLEFGCLVLRWLVMVGDCEHHSIAVVWIVRNAWTFNNYVVYLCCAVVFHLLLRNLYCAI